MSDIDPAAAARQADALSEAMQPLLRGKHPGVQGAALADLTAIWLRGHLIVGDPARTTELRCDLLNAHVEKIWELIELYDRQ